MVRRLFTRLLAIIPSMVVAIAVGRPGVNNLLVMSQVVLSIVLPFILFPLIWCTSSKAVMSVKAENHRSEESLQGVITVAVERAGDLNPRPDNRSNDVANGAEAEETVDYSNSKVVIVIAWMIWLVITAANIYALVEIGMNPS